MSLLAVVAVLVVGAGGMVFRTFSPQQSPSPEIKPAKESPALPLPDKPSVAVLPFTNLSGDTGQAYFSDGMTETLITDLSQFSGLFVIARDSVFTYKDKPAKLEQVSRELGVQYVVEGSVQRAGERVRINVQLIDATSARHLWAERYDRQLTDLFGLQDEITHKIVLALKVTLTPEEQARFQRAPTDNLEAYDYFLRGWEPYYRYTKGTNRQARQMYEKAIELDPQYAGAYVWLGWTHLIDWAYRWSPEPQQSLERAFELAQKARALDDSLPAVHHLLSWVYVRRRQPEQAITEAEQAIALDPNNDDGHVMRSAILGERRKPFGQHSGRLASTLVTRCGTGNWARRTI